MQTYMGGATRATVCVWRSEYNPGCWSLTSLLSEAESLVLCSAPQANWLTGFLGFSSLYLPLTLEALGLQTSAFGEQNSGRHAFMASVAPTKPFSQPSSFFEESQVPVNSAVDTR